jgi:hypothetical protein
MAYPNFKNRPKNGLRPLGINFVKDKDERIVDGNYMLNRWMKM